MPSSCQDVEIIDPARKRCTCMVWICIFSLLKSALSVEVFRLAKTAMFFALKNRMTLLNLTQENETPQLQGDMVMTCPRSLGLWQAKY